MAQRIVDLFEPVHIADDHRKIERRPGSDRLIEFFFPDKIGALALRPCHGILKSRLSCGVSFLHGLCLPFLHGEVVDKHRAESQDEKAGDKHRVHGVCPVYLVKLILNKGGLLQSGHFSIRIRDIIIPNRIDRFVRSLLIYPSGPDHGHEHNKRQQCDPNDNRFAEAAGLVLLDDLSKVEEADDGPNHEQNVRLRFQHGVTEQVREEQIEPEHQHNDKARKARDRLSALFQLSCRFERGSGNKSIQHGCAQRRHIHDPADGCSPDEGNDTADAGHKQHRVGGDVLAV